MNEHLTTTPGIATTLQSAGGATPRTVRIGLLGLGGVGQAVARICETARDALAPHGLKLEVVAALVRDPERPREFVPDHATLTSDPDAFLQADYDLVVEALGGVEPAFAYVRRVLESGTPVVTANKSLVAAKGDELFPLAKQHNTVMLCEAAVIAGMPFLTLLNNRPLAARVERMTGIMNGTTNYVLWSMEQQRVTVETAVKAAQELGYAEPDPTNDVEGIDAAEKLVIVLQHLGVRGVGRADIEVRGIRDVQLEDLLQANGLGGRIKLIAHAAFVGQRIEAFVGPTFVPDRDLLAGLSQEQNGIRLYGKEIGKLFYTGPGAGPDVTAGTLLDDVVEVLAIGPGSLQRLAAVSHGKGWECVAPTTPWFLRLVFRKGIPAPEEISEFLAAQGIWFWKTSDVQAGEAGDVLYALTHKAPRERVEAALAALREASHCDAGAYRVLEDA